MAVSDSLSPILLSLNAQVGGKVSDQDYNCYNHPGAGLRTLWRTLLRIENPPSRIRPPPPILKLSLLPTFLSPTAASLLFSAPLFPRSTNTVLCTAPSPLSVVVSNPRISIHDAVYAHQGETPHFPELCGMLEIVNSVNSSSPSRHELKASLSIPNGSSTHRHHYHNPRLPSLYLPRHWGIPISDC